MPVQPGALAIGVLTLSLRASQIRQDKGAEQVALERCCPTSSESSWGAARTGVAEAERSTSTPMASNLSAPHPHTGGAPWKALLPNPPQSQRPRPGPASRKSHPPLTPPQSPPHDGSDLFPSEFLLPSPAKLSPLGINHHFSSRQWPLPPDQCHVPPARTPPSSQSHFLTAAPMIVLK